MPSKSLTSIYFGGGTPSLMSADALSRVITKAVNEFSLSTDIEITLEANPEDITREQLQSWKALGITRLSLGVQALDDDALKFLGRAHTRDDAKRAIEDSLSHFENVSIDLIYARPGQSTSDWLRELEEALLLGAPHLSLYELTIKEKTAFAKQVEREQFVPLDDDAQADLYEATQSLCAERGLPAYEVSNHARAPSYWSRHNMTYWSGGDWLGIGPGAEGKITLNGQRTTTLAERRPTQYIDRVQQTGVGWSEKIELTDEQAAEELLILGLRSLRGANKALVESKFAKPLDVTRLDEFREHGLLIEKKGQLSLTPSGWLLADRIALELLA